jgi:O-antigen/teichoic acid export membrane protein
MSAAERGSLNRTSLHTFGFTGLTLVVTLISGIVVARALGPAGRGTITAVLTLPNVGTWLFGMGAAQALSFYVARRADASAALLATWLVYVVPLGLLAIVALEALVAPVLAAQPESTIDLARLWVPTVVLAMLGEVIYGVLLGHHRFFVYNVGRFAPAALVTLGYLLFELLSSLTVAGALWINLFATIGTTTCLAVFVVRRYGIARPSWTLGRASLGYGAKAHLANAAGTFNARLDLVILPAFLGAASVGLYGVATNVSWIVVACAGALYPVVLPMAAREADRGERGVRTVIRSLHLSVGVAVTLSLAVAIVADWALPAIYGPDFSGAAAPLKILLPGMIAIAAAQVLWSGLNAANRPLYSAYSQVPGIVITVVGLLLFLREGGIEAAALISSVAYIVVLAVALVFYKHAADIPWSTFVRGAASEPRPAVSDRALGGR